MVVLCSLLVSVLRQPIEDHQIPITVTPMAKTTTATVTDAVAQSSPCPDVAFFTPADNIVLEELYRDIGEAQRTGKKHPALDSQEALRRLDALNNPRDAEFQPTVFCDRDVSLANVKIKSANDLKSALLNKYVAWARTIVRHETDVVFLTHIIMYFTTSVPSAIYLFYDFHYWHGIAHVLMQVWYSGAFTLMMHNHIHNNGVLQKSFSAFDWTFPYILEPLMGHTWDSYYYHHVKAHHVEGNGPDDLSSTIRYQRDSALAFLQYEMRFLLLCWYDLTKYFVVKGKYKLASRVFVTEMFSYTYMLLLARWTPKPATFVLIIPFVIMRIGLMAGNWGQHALVDEVDPNSDFRSSITLIDVPVSLLGPFIFHLQY